MGLLSVSLFWRMVGESLYSCCRYVLCMFYSMRKKQFEYLSLRIHCLRNYFYAGKSQNSRASRIIPQDLEVTNYGVLQGTNLVYLALLILKCKVIPLSNVFAYHITPGPISRLAFILSFSTSQPHTCTQRHGIYIPVVSLQMTTCFAYTYKPLA